MTNFYYLHSRNTCTELISLCIKETMHFKVTITAQLGVNIVLDRHYYIFRQFQTLRHLLFEFKYPKYRSMSLNGPLRCAKWSFKSNFMTGIKTKDLSLVKSKNLSIFSFLKLGIDDYIKQQLAKKYENLSGPDQQFSNCGLL